MNFGFHERLNEDQKVILNYKISDIFKSCKHFVFDIKINRLLLFHFVFQLLSFLSGIKNCFFCSANEVLILCFIYKKNQIV
jgi:hypothetical protein